MWAGPLLLIVATAIQVYAGGAWSVAMIAVLGIFLVVTSSGTKSITSAVHNKSNRLSGEAVGESMTTEQLARLRWLKQVVLVGATGRR